MFSVSLDAKIAGPVSHVHQSTLNLHMSFPMRVWTSPKRSQGLAMCASSLFIPATQNR